MSKDNFLLLHLDSNPCSMNTKSHLLYYIDDDDDDLDFFVEAGTDLGDLVRPFHNATELLRAIRQPEQLPDAIFLDLNMPLTSGFDVLRILKKLKSCRNIPIVILSTAGSCPSIEMCRKLGADLYIVKPKTFGKIRELITHVKSIPWEAGRPPANDFVYKP